MKKNIILFSLALGYVCTTTHAHALIYKKNSSRRPLFNIVGIKFGAGVGGSMARLNSIKTDSDTTQLPRFGFHAQAFGAYQLNEYLGVKLAIGYHAKGNRLKRTIQVVDNFRSERKLHFDYLQTSIHLNIFPNSDRQFFFIAGGYTAYLLVAKEHKVTYENNQQQGEPEIIDLKATASENQLNKLDLGFVLGLGYEFEIGLIFQAVSELGIRKIHDIDETPGRNLAGNLSLEYNFAKLLE